MGTTKQLPTWAEQHETPDWARTPIWDAEFAERWDALHAELTEPEPPPAPRKPRQPRVKSPR